MVYIVLRKSSYDKRLVRIVNSLEDEIIDSLNSPEGTWLEDGDEIYKAELVSKVVRKPKVIKTSELVLEGVR